MPRARILVPLAALVTAALAGCGREAAPRVEPGTDTVVAAAAMATTDTHPPPPAAPEAGDCRYTDARPRPGMGDPRYGQRYDSAAIARGVEYRCTLRPGEPEVRLVVGGEWSIPLGVQVYLPADAPRPLQALAVDNDEPAREGADLLKGEDLNGDGWMDFYVYTFSGTAGQLAALSLTPCRE